MSKPIMSEDGKVVDRNGEFYPVQSSYHLPTDPEIIKEPFECLITNVDELQNKPRRFFDTLLSVVEAKRSHKVADKASWTHLVEGCEQWTNAVENGLYNVVQIYAIKKDDPHAAMKRDLQDKIGALIDAAWDAAPCATTLRENGWLECDTHGWSSNDPDFRCPYSSP